MIVGSPRIENSSYSHERTLGHSFEQSTISPDGLRVPSEALLASTKLRERGSPIPYGPCLDVIFIILIINIITVDLWYVYVKCCWELDSIYTDPRVENLIKGLSGGKSHSNCSALIKRIGN